MHPFLQAQLAALHQNDLHAEASRGRAARQRAEADDLYWARVVIRRATSADGPALTALAALDAAPVPHGPVLIAEVSGVPRAVMPLDGGEPFGDPFARTAELVELLELRKAQISGSEPEADRRRSGLAAMAAAGLRRRFA